MKEDPEVEVVGPPERITRLGELEDHHPAPSSRLFPSPQGGPYVGDVPEGKAYGGTVENPFREGQSFSSAGPELYLPLMPPLSPSPRHLGISSQKSTPTTRPLDPPPGLRASSGPVATSGSPEPLLKPTFGRRTSSSPCPC